LTAYLAEFWGRAAATTEHTSARNVAAVFLISPTSSRSLPKKPSIVSHSRGSRNKTIQNLAKGSANPAGRKDAQRGLSWRPRRGRSIAQRLPVSPNVLPCPCAVGRWKAGTSNLISQSRDANPPSCCLDPIAPDLTPISRLLLMPGNQRCEKLGICNFCGESDSILQEAEHLQTVDPAWVALM